MTLILLILAAVAIGVAVYLFTRKKGPKIPQKPEGPTTPSPSPPTPPSPPSQMPPPM